MRTPLPAPLRLLQTILTRLLALSILTFILHKSSSVPSIDKLATLSRILVSEARLDRVDDEKANVDFPHNSVIEDKNGEGKVGTNEFGRSVKVLKQGEKDMRVVIGSGNGYEVVSVNEDLKGEIVGVGNQTYERSGLGVSVVDVRLDDGVFGMGSGDGRFLIGDSVKGLVYVGNGGDGNYKEVLDGSSKPVFKKGDHKNGKSSMFGVAMSSVWNEKLKENLVCVGAPESNFVDVLGLKVDGDFRLVQRIKGKNLGDGVALGFGKHCTITQEWLAVSMTNDLEVYRWDEANGKFDNRTSMKSRLDNKALNVTAFEGGATAMDEGRMFAVSPLGTYCFELKSSPEGLRWEFSKMLEEPVRPTAVVVKGKTAVIGGDHHAVVLKWAVDRGVWRPKYRLTDGVRKTKFVYSRAVELAGSVVFIGEPMWDRVLMWDLNDAPIPTPAPTLPPTPNVLPLPEPRLDPRICFDAEAKIRVWSGYKYASPRSVRIGDVQVGDLVESWQASGKSVWSEVFLTQHSGDNNFRGTIVDVEWSSFDNRGVLRVTPGHYLENKNGLVLPEELKAGDELLVRGGVRASVTGTSIRHGVSVMNVHTMNDGIVVDGVFATCFPKVLVGGHVDFYKWLWWSMWALKMLYFVGGPKAVAQVDLVIHKLAPILTSPILGSIVLLILLRWFSRLHNRKRLKTS